MTLQLEEHESPTPAFHLTKQPPFEEAVTPYLDGNPHRYVMEWHFDSCTVTRDGDGVFDTGKVERMRFTSAARDWKDFTRDFWQAIRGCLGVVSRRAAIEKALIRREARRLGRMP